MSHDAVTVPRPDPPVRAPTRPRGHRTRAALRGVVTGHALAICGQPVLAGLLLSGHYEALDLHALGADVTFYLGLLQLAVAVGVALRCRRWWPLAVTVLIAAGETGQYVAGLAGALDLHIPLGVALVATCAVLVVAVWRPGSCGVPERRR